MQVYSAVDPNSETGERILKIIRWMLRGFMAFGAICLSVAAVTLAAALNDRIGSVETEGTIVGFNASGFPTVEYEVDGTTYRFVSNVTSSSMREGQSYRVRYPQDDPADGHSVAGSYVLPIVFGALGVGFTVIPWVVKKFTVDLIDKVAEEKEEQPVQL